jgi:hypothetical protein
MVRTRLSDGTASIMGTSGARQLFSTGNGGVVMRAITHIEQEVSMGKNTVTYRYYRHRRCRIKSTRQPCWNYRTRER